MGSAVRSFDPDEVGDVGGRPAGFDWLGPVEQARPAAATWVRPTLLAGERCLTVADPLAGLFPRDGIARGSTVGITGRGATSVAFALLGAASSSGSWSAWIGVDDIGWAAAADGGVVLDRVLVIPEVPIAGWAEVVAALTDAVDVVVISPSHRVGDADARSLVARARERGSVILVLASEGCWPSCCDVVLRSEVERWVGLAEPHEQRPVMRGQVTDAVMGHGHLRERKLRVHRTGRRGAAQARDLAVWLPRQV